MSDIIATIYYTADIITPDDTDTDTYGDECEPGDGLAIESGWYDADYSAWEVFEDQVDVRPDLIVSDALEDGATLDELIIETITSRLGVLDSFDGESAYAADAQENYKTGASVMLAAHVTRS